MIRLRVLALVTLFAPMLAGSLLASNNESSFGIKLHGYGSYEFGQMVRGHGANDMEFRRVWRPKLYVNIKVDMSIKKRFHMIVGPEVKMYGQFPVNETDPGRFDMKAKYDTYFHECSFRADIGNLEKPFLSVSLGLFRYKYNPHVRSLGEYMFRTGTYPNYAHNEFDQDSVRLLGALVHANLFDSLWQQDLIFNSHTQFYPRDDYNLSYITSVNFLKGLTIGGGINFDRLVSVDNSLTTPESPTNMYFKGANTFDSITPFGDTISITQYNDTGYYSFKGIKLMGRIAIDPKKFFPNVSFFGSEDLILYGEAIILGVEDIINDDIDTSILKHPYENRGDRTHFMIGFNIPTFKLLDVFSFEIQQWNSPFANEYYNVRRTFVPQPYNVNGWDPRPNVKTKWSIYLKKSFLDHFAIIAAFARDNSFDLDETDYEPNVDFEETYRYYNDWYWRVKLIGIF